MPVLEAVLAGVGLVALVGGILRWQQPRPTEPRPNPDLAAPYREGLHAAMRMQVIAQDLEQQMYAEAIRRAESKSDDEP